MNHKKHEITPPPDLDIFCAVLLAVLLILSGVVAAVILAGCASQTIARGLTAKNVSGNGTVINSRLGIDAETKIPEIQTLFVSGDFSTAKAGTNAVTYREESSASVWNASSVTRKRFLCITLTDKGDLPAVVRSVAEAISASIRAEAPDAAKEAGK